MESRHRRSALKVGTCLRVMVVCDVCQCLCVCARVYVCVWLCLFFHLLFNL